MTHSFLLLSIIVLSVSLAEGGTSLDAAEQTRLVPASSKAEVRAVIVGADEYDSQPRLRGAAADAHDLERTLRGLGVRDLTALTNAQVRREAVEAAITHVTEAAHPGDLVIIAFAGHGTRLPEYFKGSNPATDPQDEVFLLPAFDKRGAGTAERILNKEMNAWLWRIEKKGADVLFVADTCHGGGLTREIDPRAGELTYRLGVNTRIEEDQLQPIATVRESRLTNTDFRQVTFVAAVDPYSKAPEVPVPGVPGFRGAVSYAVARALEGKADQNKDGVVTRRELFEYTRQVVEQLAQGQQTPSAAPLASDLVDAPVFRVANQPENPAPVAAGTILVGVVNATDEALAGLEPLDTPFLVVSGRNQPDLVWDARSHEVVSRYGDVIARDIAATDIPDIVDRTSVVDALTKLSETRPQRIMLLPNSKLHRAGERVRFQISAVTGKWLILVNVAGDGTVQMLFPLRPSDQLSGDSFELPLDIRKPFGADHVLAIVSDRRLEDVEVYIKALHNRRKAGSLLRILGRYAGDRTVRFGIAGLFTAP